MSPTSMSDARESRVYAGSLTETQSTRTWKSSNIPPFHLSQATHSHVPNAVEASALSSKETDGLRRLIYNVSRSDGVPARVSEGLDAPRSLATNDMTPDSFDKWINRVSQTPLPLSATTAERRRVHDAQQLLELRAIRSSQSDLLARLSDARDVLIHSLRSPFSRRFAEMQGLSFHAPSDTDDSNAGSVSSSRAGTEHSLDEEMHVGSSQSMDVSSDKDSSESLDDYMSDESMAGHGALTLERGTADSGEGTPALTAAVGALGSVEPGEYADASTGRKRGRVGGPGSSLENPFVLED